MFTKKVASNISFKNPKLEFLWETDSLLTDIESAIYDDKSNTIYTTNINGHWLKKNGKGFISKVNLEGKITNLKWINNIEGPTGTAIYNNKLYVADFDKVLKINISTGEIEKSCLIKGTERINDLTVSNNGAIYGTATKTGKLFAINNGKTTILNNNLNWPNGVLFENGKLLVGLGDKTVSFFDLKNQTQKLLTNGISNPDGIVPIGNGDYLISSWEGMIHYVTKDGKKTLLLDTRKEKINAADITYIPSKKMVLVPAMLQNKLMAYKLID
ncbi:hypothetical protein WH52_05470 [Tenacibaculum holothuriorum]|uniref:Uncharacterized protein n=2 Tax=Tenacibaculum holothuriorum TaxID=1635173 RepID=A0A1Y2PFJ5_9FLAO|nr:hypothetical protein WH52_05470 [Tenacibaculum holothuriorum]